MSGYFCSKYSWLLLNCPKVDAVDREPGEHVRQAQPHVSPAVRSGHVRRYYRERSASAEAYAPIPNEPGGLIA